MGVAPGASHAIESKNGYWPSDPGSGYVDVKNPAKNASLLVVAA